MEAGAQAIWSMLGLAPGASKEQIRKQFKTFVRTEHPDVKGAPGPAAIEKFTRVMEAYRDIMASDEDRFWLECTCAKVDEIVKAQRAGWMRRREGRRKAAMLAAYEEYKQDQEVGVVSDTSVAAAPGGWSLDQVFMAFVGAVGIFLVASVAAIAMTPFR